MLDRLTSLCKSVPKRHILEFEESKKLYFPAEQKKKNKQIF